MKDKTIGAIREWRLTDHGFEHGQYFQGHSPSNAFAWTDSATGYGDTRAEALQDALEQLANGGVTVTAAEEEAMKGELSTKDENAHEGCQDAYLGEFARGSVYETSYANWHEDCEIAYRVSVDVACDEET